MASEILRDGSYVTIMGTCLIVAIRQLGAVKRSRERAEASKPATVVCPVTMNGFKAVVESLSKDIREYTEVLREVSSDVKLLLDRTRRE